MFPARSMNEVQLNRCQLMVISDMVEAAHKVGF